MALPPTLVSSFALLLCSSLLFPDCYWDLCGCWTAKSSPGLFLIKTNLIQRKPQNFVASNTGKCMVHKHPVDTWAGLCPHVGHASSFPTSSTKRCVCGMFWFWQSSPWCYLFDVLILLLVFTGPVWQTLLKCSGCSMFSFVLVSRYPAGVSSSY